VQHRRQLQDCSPTPRWVRGGAGAFLGGLIGMGISFLGGAKYAPGSIGYNVMGVGLPLLAIGGGAYALGHKPQCGR
jgi:hypothetical protein